MNTKLTSTEEVQMYIAVLDRLISMRAYLRGREGKYQRYNIGAITALRHMRRVLRPSRSLGIVVRHL